MAEQSADAEAPEAAFRSGPPPRRTPLRDNLESIVIAILLVLCVRQMVVEAFRIRHGSMAPTLSGDHYEVQCPNCGWMFEVGEDKVGRDGEVECPNCRYTWEGAAIYDELGRPLRFRWPAWLWNTARAPDGRVLTGAQAANRVPRSASRIFVNKFVYRFRKPRRWEVAVFIFPVYEAYCPDCDWRGEVRKIEGARCPICGSERLEIEAKNFIKRIVGLPGERISLRDGDVYVNGRLERKPAEVQKGLWFHVFDSSFMPREEVVPTWDLSTAPQRWARQPQGGVLEVDALGSEEPVMGAFGREIRDFYPYDGVSLKAGGGVGSSGGAVVGDCRIQARVRLSEAGEDGAVLLSIRDGGRIFYFSVGVGPDAEAVLREYDTPIRRIPVRGLSRQASRRLALQNYDDRVVVRLDDEELFTYEYQSRTAVEHGVGFGARDARVTWERIAIDRDVYYAPAGGREPGYAYEVAQGEYFVLGDNSPASSDSRRWEDPGIPRENLIGRAMVTFWPLHQLKWMGSPDDGGSARAAVR